MAPVGTREGYTQTALTSLSHVPSCVPQGPLHLLRGGVQPPCRDLSVPAQVLTSLLEIVAFSHFKFLQTAPGTFSGPKDRRACRVLQPNFPLRLEGQKKKDKTLRNIDNRGQCFRIIPLLPS